MSRPSTNVGAKLVKAGKKLLPQTGFSGLSLRCLAKKAGVNLGMFHYCFKSKKVFAKKVFQELYEEFFQKFEFKAVSGKNNFENLENAFKEFAFFASANAEILVFFMRDALNGCSFASDIIYKTAPRHIKVILGLIKKCQKEKSIVKMPPEQVFVFLAGAVVAPFVIFRAGGKIPKNLKAKSDYGGLEKHIMSKNTVEKRIKMALFAVKNRKGGI